MAIDRNHRPSPSPLECSGPFLRSNYPMPNPLITIPADNQGRHINVQTVYTKTAWADEWTEQPGVVCTKATWTASPTIPTASFYYRYGVGSVDGSDVQVWEKFTLENYGYVRVVFNTFDLTKETDDPEYETTLEWIGLAVEKEDMPHGDQQVFDEEAREQGLQTFHAVGFEYLLDRAYVTSARAKEEDQTAEDLLFCPEFNYRGRANATETAAHANTEGVESKVFFIPARSTTTPTETATHWSTLDICKFICAWCTPKSYFPTLVLPFEFDDVDDVMPTWDEPQLNLEGQRVLVVLQNLVQRQRGLGFRLVVEPRESETDIIKVIPFSLRDTTASAGTLGTWAANVNKVDLDLRNVAGVVINDDGHSRFDRVRVVGGKVIYCFTGPQYTDQFAEGWISAQETIYADGVSGHDDYGDWDESKQKILDSLALSSAETKDVWTKFNLNERIPPQKKHFPPLNDLATTSTDIAPDMRYWFQRPILPMVPLNVGVDYTDGGSEFVWDDSIESPMAFATTDIDGTDVAFDMRFGGLGVADTDNADATKMAFSVNVVATPNPREYSLHVMGTLPHLVGFGGPAAISRDFGTAPGIEVEKITLAIEGDRRTEVTASTTAEVEAVREQVIDLGDNYRVVVMVKDTIFGINPLTATTGPASEYKKITTTKIIRDDRPEMESIASAAIAWYGTDRRSLRWTTKVPLSNLYVGQMVDQIQVNATTTANAKTVITSISMQTTVAEGQGSTVVTEWSYETQFAELDFV